MKYFFLTFLFSSFLYPQNDSALFKIYNDFNIYTQSVDESESCQVVKKQLSNALNLSMERNASIFREIINTENDILKFFDDFLILFFANKPIMVQYLALCTDITNSIFDSNTLGWKLMIYALYEDPRTFVNIYKSFDILRSIHIQIDSSDILFENWSPEIVKISDKPIDYKNGTFYERDTDSNEYYFTRNDDVQIEYHNKIHNTSSWKVKWNNQFEYEMNFISNDSGLNMFETDDKVICRIIEITDSSYKVIIKSKYITLPGELVEFKK